MSYITSYMKHHDIGEQDIVYCKVRAKGCQNISTELHHIRYKSQGGKDNVENLIPTCRNCHILCHAKKITQKELYEYNAN